MSKKKKIFYETLQILIYIYIINFIDIFIIIIPTF